MLILLLLLQLSSTTVTDCETDWLEFEGYCYTRLENKISTYAEAEGNCTLVGALLPPITTQKQADFLTYRFPLAITGMIPYDNNKYFMHPLFGNSSIPGCGLAIEDNAPCSYIFQLVEDENCLIAVGCSSGIGYLCRKDAPITTIPIKTTTTTKSTTKKVTTTTPKPSIIENPKRWIIDYSKGTQIHRSFHSGQSVHHYTIDWRNTPAGFNREVGDGFVVSEARFPQIKQTCPNLFKVGVWRYGAMTYIGNSPPGSFVKHESFYCAPSQFYCGANFLLRRLDKQQGGDILYASNETEANQQLLGFPPGFFAANWYKETPCWIWQDYTDTWYSIVIANGGMIWSGYNAPGIVHFYTLQRHLIPADFQKERAAPPGYVVMQNLYDSYFKTRCPELIPMKIWHGQNGAGQTITWIGREGKTPPATVRNGWVEELRFYCAPRFNYCNANYLLRRMDKTNGAVTFYYPWSEENAVGQLKGDAPGVFKNSRWSEEVCYIWANWL